MIHCYSSVQIILRRSKRNAIGYREKSENFDSKTGARCSRMETWQEAQVRVDASLTFGCL